MTNHNEMTDPTNCDWCGIVFNYGDGDKLGTDDVCTDCMNPAKVAN